MKPYPFRKRKPFAFGEVFLAETSYASWSMTTPALTASAPAERALAASHKRVADERARIEAAQQLLVKGRRVVVCTECDRVMTAADQYPEWQHEGCGGLVMEFVARRPLLDALSEQLNLPV